MACNTPAMNQVAQQQIDCIAGECSDIKPLVAIPCITYNHEPYIRDALEGFVMQKTTFPFVAIVHDDASTDGTADIIREYAEKYPDIIKPIYETENQYSKKNGSITRIMNAAVVATGAKYVAYCEGDDYWTDPLKLQKQAVFLEAHPDYSMSYTDAIRLYQDKNERVNLSCKGIESINQLLLSNTICTPTVVIRHDILNTYADSKIRSDLGRQMMGDYQTWLWAALNGKINHLPEVATTYRVLNSSASHGSFSYWIKFLLSASTIRLRFAKEVPIDTTIIYSQKLFLELVLAYEQGNCVRVSEVRNDMRKLPLSKLSWASKMKISIATRFPSIAHALLKLRFKQDVSPSWIYIILQRIMRKYMANR